jgi:hypothetical protein
MAGALQRVGPPVGAGCRLSFIEGSFSERLRHRVIPALGLLTRSGAGLGATAAAVAASNAGYSS